MTQVRQSMSCHFLPSTKLRNTQNQLVTHNCNSIGIGLTHEHDIQFCTLDGEETRKPHCKKHIGKHESKHTCYSTAFVAHVFWENRVVSFIYKYTITIPYLHIQQQYFVYGYSRKLDRLCDSITNKHGPTRPTVSE